MHRIFRLSSGTREGDWIVSGTRVWSIFFVSISQDYDDRSPIIDCVVWRDDKDTWRAAVDTTDLEEEGSSVGKLADFVPLTNFR